MSQDVIDHLVGADLKLRHRRPVTKEQTQASYQALFEGNNLGSLALSDRFAVALFVAALHRDPSAQDFYADKLRSVDEALIALLEKAATTALTAGPYGHYPQGPLSGENSDGLDWQVEKTLAVSLGTKLTAALEHAHFLIFHPRDATKSRLEKLSQAGFDPPAIVTLSQLVAFLSYQLRVAFGLRVLAANTAATV